MGLFKSSNQKLFEKALKEVGAKPIRKTVRCPKCGRSYTATFLGPNDSVTCKCGKRIRCN